VSGQRAGQRLPVSRWAALGALLAVAAVLIAMLAPIGTRLGWWGFADAVRIAGWAGYLAGVAAVVCVGGLLDARPGRPRAGFVPALVGFVLTVSLLAYMESWKTAKVEYPPISDITTDTDNPPSFWSAPNAREYEGFEAAAWQESAYPDIQPLVLSLPPDTVYDLVLALVDRRGWQLWEASRDDLHIEATDETFWFGFKDDVVIHLTPLPDGRTRVDMRSTSRSGGSASDAGTNARRIRRFLRDLQRAAERSAEGATR